MPHEPKKRHSRQRQGKRRASISLTTPKLTTCANCRVKIPFHIVCYACGYYKGAQVVSAQTKQK